MIKTLRYTFMAVIALICGSMSAQEVQPEVTLDFTSNDTWKIPVKDAMGKTEQTFTNGTYSIKLAAPDGYYYNTKDKYIMLGKKGATLTLPTFTFPVSKIEVVGKNNASAKVEQNIFVGENEVSTKTVGANKTNTYKIDADNQAAGTVFVFKVLSAQNTQITKINIYKAEGKQKKSAGLKFSETTIDYELGTTFTAPTFTKTTTAAVKFVSDNEEVATVNAEGVIAATGKEGKAVITATSEENDEFNAGNATCTVYAYRMNVYKKATAVEAGKQYLIVAQRDNKTYYAAPVKYNAEKPYGYLNSFAVDGIVDELKIKSSYNDAFTFEGVEGGYAIKDANGHYLYMDENVKHNTFQLGDEAKAWTVEPAENGTFTITNNGKFIQYGNGTYTTFGAWKEAQDKAVKPMLFVFDEAAGINGVQTTVKPQSNVRYNIAGQRVGADYKGIVIVNGKKYLQK
jgi:hypothetical protein